MDRHFSFMRETAHALLTDHKRLFGQDRGDEALMMRRLRMNRRDLTIPEPKDINRKEGCRDDLEKYLRTYHPGTFSKPFCNDHKRIIRLLQEAIQGDEDQAIAADRGKGKSSIVKCSCGWAINYGHRLFPFWIGATGSRVKQNYRNFKSMYERDEILIADFPEMCIPILALGGSSRGADSQTAYGERTYIHWAADYLAFPVIKGLRDFQTYFTTATITGAIRGVNYNDTRPDIAILDDIETRESVDSITQTEDRNRTIEEDVAGLAGQGGKFSAILIGSIMAMDSIADVKTDPVRSPSWHGERFRFIEHFPENAEMWENFVAMYRDTNNQGPDAANKYLKDNFEAMHKGAVASWPESFNPTRGEMSALHHYYIQLARYGERFVACEYQNDPSSVEGAAQQDLTASAIANRTNGVERGVVPSERDTITAFIDVKDETLHWCVAAFSSAGFGGAVIDYGTHTVRKTPGGKEASVRAGLDELAEKILGREWQFEDGTFGRVNQALVDSGYGALTETVYKFVRASSFANILYPSKGVGIKPSDQIYIGGNRGNRGGRRRTKDGLRWAIGPTTTGRLKVRLCVFDTNHWKSFLATRWKSPVGAADSMSLFGRDERTHRLFSEHQVAEKSTRLVVEKTGVVYEQWQERRGGQGKWPNDWFDCLVGCCVAASIAGARLLIPEGDREPERRYRTVGADELKALGGM